MKSTTTCGWKTIVISTIITALTINATVSQVYYGKNGFGKMTFVNDSLVELNFVAFPGGFHTYIGTKVGYAKKGDTLFLTTCNKRCIKYKYHENRNHARETMCGSPVLFKAFKRNPADGSHLLEYSLLSESVFNLDSMTNSISVPSVFLPNDGIVVVGIHGCYRRFVFVEKPEYEIKQYELIINLSNAFVNELIFDNFPLLIRGDTIIPLDKEKNYLCWIDNGFYFPKMTKTDKKKKFNYFCGILKIGLQGLYGVYENQELELIRKTKGYVHPNNIQRHNKESGKIESFWVD